jgi:hypothetical protein
MENERSEFEQVADMLGVETHLLRQVMASWIAQTNRKPLGVEGFAERMRAVVGIANELNNTNLWEEAIRTAMDPCDIPITLPTAGVPRFVVHPGGKKDDEGGKDE